MKLGEMLKRLEGADPESEVDISLVTEKDDNGYEWKRTAPLGAVWVFAEVPGRGPVVALDERTEQERGDA